MSANTRKTNENLHAKAKSNMFLHLLTALFFAVAVVAIKPAVAANNFSVSDEVTPQFVAFSATPEPVNTASQTTARIKITLGETRVVAVAGAANSALVVSPEIASAEIKNGGEAVISGLKIGETILIIYGGAARQTFVVEVAAKPSMAARRQSSFLAESEIDRNAKMSGFFNVLYAQGFEQSPSLVRNRFELRREFSNNRTFRASGEMFKFFGGGNPQYGQTGFGNFQNYGLDRIAVGIDTPNKTIDFLDSQLRLSPASFNSFEMRGFHLTMAPKHSNDSDSARQGVEVFAGINRPSAYFYDANRAKFFGAAIPVAAGDSWQVRAGFVSVFAPTDNQTGRGGTVLRLDGTYAPNKNFSADGAIGVSGNDVSWSARLNLKTTKFGAFGEVNRTNKNSPLALLGNISGGRQTEAFGAYWRFLNRFNFSANYSHSQFVRFTNSKNISFNRATFSANASYRPNQNSRLFVRFTDREIETAAPASFAKYQIASRTFSIGYDIRFNRHLSNDFEAGINFSREREAAAKLENGFDLREQLRLSFGRNSLTGFVNYTDKTPSLNGLIMRNPQLLPLELQPVFAINPAQFLQVYRDRLAFLLPAVELAQTRRLDAGIRFQTNTKRVNFTGEARYAAGGIFGQNQKNLFTSIGVNVRLDAANSVQINGWRSFGQTNNQTSLIFGFTHRFGSEAGGGFQFSKFLGFDRGKIGGRVYYDSNGNGQDDANEPGVSGLTVRLNEKSTVKTDANGRYQFSASEGSNSVALVSEDLGVRFNASTATTKQISLRARQTAIVSFGVSGFGFVAGRVFNDSGSSGLVGVRLILRGIDGQSENFVVAQTSGSGGRYEFRNVRPGNYLLEIDAATLPVNFRIPAQIAREIKVAPLAGFYLDIPVAAQRAVAGVVFVDKDGDGQFNPQTDEPVEGALVTANETTVVSDRSGAYMVRNLGAGRIKIAVRSPLKAVNPPAFVELSSEPTTKRAFNIAVQR